MYVGVSYITSYPKIYFINSKSCTRYVSLDFPCFLESLIYDYWYFYALKSSIFQFSFTLFLFPSCFSNFLFAWIIILFVLFEVSSCFSSYALLLYLIIEYFFLLFLWRSKEHPNLLHNLYFICFLYNLVMVYDSH